MVLIETKKEQLAAIVNAYQALGGGNYVTSSNPTPQSPVPPNPATPNLAPPAPRP